MTTSMALALNARLDEAVAKVDEEKRYCAERLAIEKTAAEAKLSVVEDTAAQREALVRDELNAEGLRTQRALEQVEYEKNQHWLYGTGGVVGGVLVGVVVTGAVLIYSWSSLQ
jgi:hypothetical protein